MEREIAITGVGGQGVQLGAQVLARAATLEDRHVLMFGIYGGAMRGGSTESTLVVGDGLISAPPIVSRVWSALAMHHEYWETLRSKLRPGGLVLVNSTLFEGHLDREAQRVIDVPATELAAGVGSSLAAAMVLVGAYAAVTGLVGFDSLVRAMEESLPPYRSQHIQTNAKALRAGFDAVPQDVVPAWPTVES
ncbi:MAG: 2-oxoacid:acceptor oxidoreductase family protein [Myxococcota bacterium]